MKKSALAIISLASLLSLGALFTSYGKEEKAITSIPLSFSWDKKPRGGEWVGKVYAKTRSSQFIVDGAVYDKEEDTWFFGESPIVEVDLSAKEGFCFTTTDRNSFSLSGCDAQFKEATMEEDGSSLTLRVSLTQLEGTLPVTTAAGWNGNTAVWDEVEGAERYEIKLYNDNTLTATTTSSGTSCDLSSFINHEGTYTFNVKTLGTYQTQSSSWSESAGPYTVAKEDAWYISNGTWHNTSAGWRFIYENDAYPVNTWRFINDKWYYFNQQGYMAANCYVKSPDEETYRWLGSDGAWDTESDTPAPDTGLYDVIR